ncbi:hypothetical protein OUZ56_033611 [Daphnia magna]|uniref:Uncharacterized protein n=1 Tax=Daphnia magna TaxID=35525 RepID=A0ABR0BAW5_9CRUS|nr:hypothetical protein OUZ56_033611 [Daphnia magna]
MERASNLQQLGPPRGYRTLLWESEKKNTMAPNQLEELCGEKSGGDQFTEEEPDEINYKK